MKTRNSLLLATLAVSATAIAQQSMPLPRYQSPGVPAAEAPAARYSLPPTVSITPNAEVVEDVIVRVNDQVISRSDVMRSMAQLQQEIAANGPAAGSPAERQKNLLRDLIDQQLLLSRGKELGINPDADVIRRLDEIRKQNNLPSMEALEEAAKQQGVSFEDFKATIRNGLVTQQVVRDEVGRSLRMTRAEEQKFYDANKEMFAEPEQIRLSEILVPTAANADDAALAAAKATSEDIYAKLKSGADFAATAKTSSGGPTAAQGGDLGLFKRGALAPVLEEKTFPLPVGGFTESTRTRQGYVILKVTEHQQAGTPPLEKIEGEVQNAMYQEQVTPALRVYLTKLREDAYVDIRPGFVDSGASAKQTKPVFSAYTAPAPKKKVVVKQRMEAQKDARTLATRGGLQPAIAILDKNGKPVKVKREKIRFGQAPRTALPEAPDSGATANPAAPGSTTAADNVAPGTQLNPLETINTVAANTPVADDDPLAPKAAPEKKTRYASREPEIKVRKADVKVAKTEDRARAKPVAASSEEKQAQATQATALGLNGATADKKKNKRVKGEPKERLQNKPEEAKPALDDNGLPDRLHQLNGPAKDTTKPAADGTTLAPVTAPAPGATIPTQGAAATGASPAASPVPQQ